MRVALPERNLPLTREEYLRWCAQQARGRFERVDGEVVAMAPERGAHLRVKLAVVVELRRAIAASGLPCQAIPDGATVQTDDSDFEPDAAVNCGPSMGDDEVTLPNPVVVAEVLSPGTASVDTGLKLAGYFQVPSIAHYLIVHPTRRVVIHHHRAGDGIRTAVLPGGSLVLDPPGMTVLIDNFYTDTPSTT